MMFVAVIFLSVQAGVFDKIVLCEGKTGRISQAVIQHNIF